ncbi:MAG: phytoene desaturase family protein [Verrucomicrobiales bacterium]
MKNGFDYDAVVVGSGPNGFSAAITFARAGLSTLIIEGKETLGGGCRTAELTLPGFHHDICSAIHPTGVVSPIFRDMRLEEHGLEWVQTTTPLAHPLPDGSVALMEKSLSETAKTLGPDGRAWERMMQPFLKAGDAFFKEILKPIRIPKHPIMMAQFGLMGLRSSKALSEAKFKGAAARALFTGCAAHSILPLDAIGTASFGLVLALSGHAIGWPCIKGGSIEIIRSMERLFLKLGGKIETGRMVRSLKDIPSSKVVLFDLSPRQITAIAGDALPTQFAKKYNRYRFGPGIFKLDAALTGPIPWKNPECFKSATVHVGGTYQEIMASEAGLLRGEVAEKPFVLVAQQSLFDSTRAPAGKHTLWAYCHVPHGCDRDMTEAIERQIERFAPGFRDLILQRHIFNPAKLEAHNPNMIGGDIGGGANDLKQFMLRPIPRFDPYSTANKRLFICSSSTPPGGGVHGMCGYLSARSALKREFGITKSPFA